MICILPDIVSTDILLGFTSPADIYLLLPRIVLLDDLISELIEVVLKNALSKFSGDLLLVFLYRILRPESTIYFY